MKRINYHCSDFGIMPGVDCTKKMNDMFIYLSSVHGEKHVYFDKGYYEFSLKDSVALDVKITETERVIYDIDNKSRTFGFVMNKIDNLVLHGNKTRFLYKSAMSYLAIINSTNVVIDGIEFFSKTFNMHRLKVLRVEPGKFIDVRLSASSEYMCQNGDYYFIGDNFNMAFRDHAEDGSWYRKVEKNKSYSLQASDHPLYGAKYIDNLRDHKFRVIGKLSKDIKVDDEYYIFPKYSKNLGIFIDKSKNIYFNNVGVRYSDSHAILAQCCTDIFFNHMNFSPQNSMRLGAITDCIQISNCRGDVSVTNSIIKGTKDGINVHGIDFSVQQIYHNLNSVIVTFNNDKTFGFNPMMAGDIVEFIDNETMLPISKNIIVSSRLITDHTIEIFLKYDIKATAQNNLRDVSAFPSCLTIRNNYFDDITKDAIKNNTPIAIIDRNVFNDVDRNAISIVTDSIKHFNSVSIKKLEITNNVFARSSNYDILIENRESKKRMNSYVHENIYLANNVFMKKSNRHVKIYNCKDIYLHANILKHSCKVYAFKLYNCSVLKHK